MPYVSRAEREAGLWITWSELLQHVQNSEQCAAGEARRQVGDAINDRALLWRWEDAEPQLAGTGSATVVGKVALHPTNYWQTCEVDRGNPDRIYEAPPYDPARVNNRTAKRLDRGRCFRKPLFKREQAMRIWGPRGEALDQPLKVDGEIPPKDLQPGAATKMQNMTTLRAKEFAGKFISAAREAGRRPTITALEKSASRSGFKGGRVFLRSEFKKQMGLDFQGPGRPRKSPP